MSWSQGYDVKAADVDAHWQLDHYLATGSQQNFRCTVSRLSYDAQAIINHAMTYLTTGSILTYCR